MTDILDSGGLYPIIESLPDATPCVCKDGKLSPEDLGETSMYGRAYRRIVCSCGRTGPWSTAPVVMWNQSF